MTENRNTHTLKIYINICIFRWAVLFLFLKFIYFNCRLLTLQYYSGFAIHWHESAMGVHVFPTLTLLPTSFPYPIPQGHPSAPALSTLSHALNLDWQSISHMIICMFQCYSLKSSHPCLLPQSPKVCLHSCLFCCLTFRVIVKIFLNVIYMHYYTLLVFFFLTCFTLHNRLQFHPPH